MNSKTQIRARHFLKFRKGSKVATTSGNLLTFVRVERLRNITHYVFEKDGRYFSFKMNVFPMLQPMNLQQYKRDEIGFINVLTFDFLLQQLRAFKTLKVVDSTRLKKVA